MSTLFLRQCLTKIVRYCLYQHDPCGLACGKQGLPGIRKGHQHLHQSRSTAEQANQRSPGRLPDQRYGQEAVLLFGCDQLRQNLSAELSDASVQQLSNRYHAAKRPGPPVCTQHGLWKIPLLVAWTWTPHR